MTPAEPAPPSDVWREAGMPLVGLPARPEWEPWVGRALDLSGRCADSGDVPVGALVVQGDPCDPASDVRVLGRGWNRREADGDPVAHAEVLALRQAAAERGGWRLDGCTLIVTLEPCVLCTGALLAARVDRVVFGAWDDKAGACGSVWDLARDRRSLHTVDVVGGVRAPECAARLREFFAARRG